MTRRMRIGAWTGTFIVCFLSGCGTEESVREVTDDQLNKEAKEAAAAFQDSIAETKERVKRIMPGSSYVDNSLIPTLEQLETAPTFESVELLRIGAPWVFNDEIAPWVVGVEKGFFREVGIEIELEEGGPGRNMITLLLGEKIDIAVTADAGRIPTALASPTGGGLKIVSTILQRSPSGILAIDRTIPNDQSSNLQITPADLRGKRVGIQGGRDRLAKVYMQASGISPDTVEVVRSGNGPELLIMDRVDFMLAWIVNQPRLLEEKGFMNWTFFPVADYYYVSPSDISVVREETLEKRPDLIWRYNWALLKSLRYVLDHPEEAAALTRPHIEASGLTLAQIERRFELQRPFILEASEEKLMHVNPDHMDDVVAYYVQAGIIELTD